MDQSIGIRSSKKDLRELLARVAIIVLSVAMLTVFIDDKFCIVLGPVIAALLCYLFFFGYSEIVIAVVLVANDALGTIAFGKVSFPYLLLLLVAIKLVMVKRYSLIEYGFFAVSAFLTLQLFFIDSMPFKSVLYSMIFIVALVLVGKSEDGKERFFRGVALTVVIIALHTCITGGVEFYTQSQYSEEFLRKGILGVGIGDSNYSCFLLNIGIICLWCDRKTHWCIKTIATIPILYAMTVTLSTSGLLSLILISVLFILVGKNKPKAIAILIVVVLIVVAVFSIYINLTTELRLESVDAYIQRMDEKIYQFIAGDMMGATTNRSDLVSQYWDYFAKQPMEKILFGGNGVIVVDDTAPHNTYIGYLLQIGLIGTMLFFGYALIRVIKRWRQRTDVTSRTRTILLKVLCLFVATNLSLYDGSLWAMWMYFLIML